MQKRLFNIEQNEAVARDTFRLVLRTDAPVAIRSGQFVDIALPGFYLRRPISVSDVLPDGVILYYKVVGEGTRAMAAMHPGKLLELLLPLGSGFHPEKCRQAVTAVLGFNRAEEICLAEEFRALGIPVLLATLDGSSGTKGFVTDAIAAGRPVFDRFYSCGPLPMMKALCAALDVPGEVSLEERMGCGAGFCYGCTVQTISGPKRVCADGPVFDKEDLPW